MSKKSKRLLVISDLHCGHNTGLTPAGFDAEKLGKPYFPVRRAIWDWYIKTADIKPDVIIVNGDTIDGRNEKSGSVEQIYLDRNDQVEMAVKCINEVKGKAKIFMISHPVTFSVGSSYIEIDIRVDSTFFQFGDKIVQPIKLLFIQSTGVIPSFYKKAARPV